MQKWQGAGIAAIVAVAGFGAAFVHFSSAAKAHEHAKHRLEQLPLDVSLFTHRGIP